MQALRQTLRGALLLAPGALAAFSLVAAFMVATLATPARAQGKLEARYTVTLAGIPIGKGGWVIDITDTQYTAAATGGTTGLLHAITGGEGSTAAHGVMQGGRLVPQTYAATISTRKKTEAIRLTIANGNVKEFTADPPQDKDPERVPITETHQHGVLDPMTASMMRVSGNGDPLQPSACHHTLAVFDGRLRYDLQLAFKRMDQVKAEKGYAGPVVVCSVYFSPVAGHIPSRTAIKYIAKLRDMEVWLAPIAGTRVLVPFRAQGPSPVGRVVLEAEQFVSVASPTRASLTGAKVQ